MTLASEAWVARSSCLKDLNDRLKHDFPDYANLANPEPLSLAEAQAVGEKQDAEALSGLARAFFYAGARALLVSHWYVDSQSSVALTTTAIADMRADHKLGRAEALQHSMLALIDRGGRLGASVQLGTVCGRG